MDESWTVRRVMSAPARTVSPDTGVKEVVELLSRYGISGLPVVDADDRLLGVVSEADLLLKEEKAGEDVRSRPFQLPGRRRVLSKAAGSNAGELMTAPAITVGPDTKLQDAARIMRERGVRRLVVVDEDHRVVGIVSRIDLLKAYMRDDAAIESDLEAIVKDVLWLQDVSLQVHVNGGIVSIDGKVGRKSDADLIVSLACRLAGVVEVRASIPFDEDDTRLSSDAREIWFRQESN